MDCRIATAATDTEERATVIGSRPTLLPDSVQPLYRLSVFSVPMKCKWCDEREQDKLILRSYPTAGGVTHDVVCLRCMWRLIQPRDDEVAPKESGSGAGEKSGHGSSGAVLSPVYAPPRPWKAIIEDLSSSRSAPEKTVKRRRARATRVSSRGVKRRGERP
jgi:hypothetical protein